MTNPYYNNLFDIINEYVSEGGKIQDGTKLEATDGVDTISVFEAVTQSASSSFNIAGNYKYSCVVPLDVNMPPNYVGVLQENNALKEGSLIYELLTFTDIKKNGYDINCNRLVADVYTNMFRTLNEKGTGFGHKDSNACMINFTNGLPYSFDGPGLRMIHKDVAKRINSMIDYAIRTGQDERTTHYNKELVKRFHDIFFDSDDGKRLPAYYALRTGILPTAISFAKWKARNEGQLSDSANATTFLAEVDQLTEGSMFIPGGLSDQFNTANNADDLCWYPFNISKSNAYKYTFKYAPKQTDSTKQAPTTEDQKYECKKGFNHYAPDNAFLSAVVFNTPANTAEVNGLCVGTSEPHSFILSYESSLSTNPAPGNVIVRPAVDQPDSKNPGKCRGITADITAITGGNGNIWANVDARGKIAMHPLLNRDGKDEYLKISTELTPDYVTDESKGNTEEAYYYNDSFTFSTEVCAVDRLNYFDNVPNTIALGDADKYCDVNKLEFAKISHKLFNVADDKLTIDSTTQVMNTTFGVISKMNKNAWNTVQLGICGYRGWCMENSNINNVYEKNGLFEWRTEKTIDPIPVPDVSMAIRALHYMDPVKAPDNGKWKHGMGCPYRNADVRPLDSKFNYCREVPYLRIGFDRDPMEWDKDRDEVDKGWKDNETFDAIVSVGTKDAQLTTYQQGNLHSLCKAVMGGDYISDFYYTIHILADDGDDHARIGIKGDSGLPDITGQSKTSYYGTGVQYFFGGVCSKDIYEAYYKKGLTVQQLLDRPTSNTNDTRKANIRFSRVADGLRRVNVTFEWDYDLLLEAWQLALWIMRDMPENGDLKISPEPNPSYVSNKPTFELWKAKKAPLAVAAFFDYLYASNHSNIRLMLGPSLKQINNMVGPYVTGSNYQFKGACVGDGDLRLNTLGGAVWNAITDHQALVNGEKTPEAIKVANIRSNLEWDDSDLKYGNRYVDASEHNLVSMHIFADKDLKIHNGETSPKMDSNGVGEDYWGKGEKNGSDSPWGTHKAITYHSWWGGDHEGNLGLDHYSWDWQIHDNKAAPTNDTELWQGAFMIHAANGTSTEHDTTGGTFNWNAGPFHQVSAAGRQHSNVYGVRQNLAFWEQSHSVPRVDVSTCDHGVEKVMHRMAWHGIKGKTHGDQNPNIRVRLPMLWRYLKALRSEKIYTDGQLMPCGVELHYNEASKAIISSIKNAEVTVPTYKNQTNNDDTVSSKNAWQNAVCNRSATVFAEVLRNTYAISNATIDKWKNIMFDATNTNNMIRDILTTVAAQKPKIVALNRAKIYMDSLVDSGTRLDNGKTVFNIPILPLVASFGTKIPDAENNMQSAISELDDPLTTIGSSLPNIYKRCPIVDPSAVVPVRSVGIGVTNTPVLGKGVETNQFTAISNALYNDILSFDGNTFGWIVPLPQSSNLALLNAYDDRWRKGKPSVIPLKLSNNEYKETIREMENLSLHWIGWFVADYIDKLKESDIAGAIHICNDSNNMADNAVVRAAMLKITPQQYSITENETEVHTDAFSEPNKASKPFAVKLEIDTRTDGGVELIMIRNTISTNMTVEYEVNNIVLPVNLPNSNQKIINNITNVTYEKDVYADASIAPL